jgi:hypothetical protein
MDALQCSKISQILHEYILESYKQLSQLLWLQIPTTSYVKNLGTDSIFESSMNFKGVQTFWEKSYKFSKIPSWLGLHKSEFSWAHVYVRIWVTKQVPKRPGLNKRKRLWIWNSNLTIFIMQTKLVSISFKLPKYIVSYYLKYCICYSDTWSVTWRMSWFGLLPWGNLLIPRIADKKT